MISFLSFIRQGNYLEAIIFVLSGCFVVFICAPVHEFAHGYVAYRLGDNTAKRQGQLTLNPLAHIDIVGMIMILVFGFGYAKAVPVNMRNFKNPKAGMALTGLAGPVSNLIMAFISIFLFYMLTALFSPAFTIVGIISMFFYYAAFINVSLAVFNLLPIPPLDGSKIVAGVLPDKIYYKYMQYERYVMIAVFVLLFTGILDRPLAILDNSMMNFISFIPHLIFR